MLRIGSLLAVMLMTTSLVAQEIAEPDARIELTGQAAENPVRIIKLLKSDVVLDNILQRADVWAIMGTSGPNTLPARAILSRHLQDKISVGISVSIPGRVVLTINIMNLDNKQAKAILANALLDTLTPSPEELEAAKNDLSTLVLLDQKLEQEINAKKNATKEGPSPVDVDEATRPLILRDIVTKLRDIELAKIDVEVKLENSTAKNAGIEVIEPLKERLEIIARQLKHLHDEQASLAELAGVKNVVKQQHDMEALTTFQRERIQLQSRIRLAEIRVKMLMANRSSSGSDIQILTRPAIK